MICNIASLRNLFGYSQVKLAHLSGVSLPTIQNIEAGKANPTTQIMEKILNALGMEFKISPFEFDGDIASCLGVPLASEKDIQILPTKELLISESRKWLHLLKLNLLTERESEAIISFLIAIRDHYPTLYKESFKNMVFEEKINNSILSGRIIKLRRMSIANLSRYL